MVSDDWFGGVAEATMRLRVEGPGSRESEGEGKGFWVLGFHVK